MSDLILVNKRKAPEIEIGSDEGDCKISKFIKKLYKIINVE